MTNFLSFSVSKSPKGKPSYAEVMPLVDSIPLLELVRDFESAQGWPKGSYGPLDPNRYRYCAWDHYFQGYCRTPMSNPEKTALLVCNCGVFTCWPLLATITTDYETLTWSQFEQPHRRERDYSAFGPFTFDWMDYKDALEELMEQTGPPE